MSETLESYEDESPQDLPPEGAQGPTDEQIEAARNQGWAPKEQWRGDPDRWVDADEYLERGAHNNAILRERNEQLLKELQSTRDEVKQSVREFGKATRAAEERAYQRAKEELKTRERDAVLTGDSETWEKIQAEKELLDRDFREFETKTAVTEPPAQPATNPDEDPAFVAWHADNGWYNNDVDATLYANEAALIIGRKYPQGQPPPRAFYDEIAQHVRKRFPEKFRNTARDNPGAVQGASHATGKRSGGKSYADLPPEAKQYCDKYVKQGLMSKEEYVKDYFGD